MTPEESAEWLAKVAELPQDRSDLKALAWRVATDIARVVGDGRLGSGSNLPCSDHDGPGPLMLMMVVDDTAPTRGVLRLCWFCRTRRILAAGQLPASQYRLTRRRGDGGPQHPSGPDVAVDGDDLPTRR